MYLTIGSQLRSKVSEHAKTTGKYRRDAPVLVVDLVPVSRRVDDVQAQPNTILNNDWRHVEAMSVAPEPKDAP